MDPILTKQGEAAARKAARDFARGNAIAHNEGNYEEGMGETQSEEGLNDKTLRVVENVCIILLLPFFWIYDCFVFVIGARLFQWGEAVFIWLRRQAHLFLNGMKPYECSVRITTVNVVVFCSTWYMFIDQIRLAFFPLESDYSLAVLNFVIWTVLSLELIFEVFIRPDGYHSLIRSDKAFTPTTVRYISGLHLVVEFVSLALFVPEFVCLFTRTDTTCHGAPVFSFLHATILAVTGPTRSQALAGRAFYACLRLRVFGLVRHWKNRWIQTTFLKRRNKYLEMAVKNKGNLQSYYDYLDKTDKNAYSVEDAENNKESFTARAKLLQKQRDAALINASNIGTALMVTNSYRALTILCTILGLFPMIALIYYKGVTDSVAVDMVGQLQGTNLLVTVENEVNCQFLVNSVESWVDSFGPKDRALITSSSSSSVEWCILGTLNKAQKSHGDDLEKQAQNLRLRIGNIQTETSQQIEQYLELEDGSVSDVAITYSVAAHFNRTHCTENS
jgi:hypothetical protein